MSMISTNLQWFGYLYGLWVALAYITFKTFALQYMLETFTVSSIISGAILAVLFPKRLMRAFQNPYVLARGSAFALTQFFIFRALSHGDAASVFAVSGGALIVSFPLAHFLLKEKVEISELTAALVAVLGVFIMQPSTKVGSFGLLAGLFQGVSVVLARKNSLSNISPMADVGVGFIIAGILLGIMGEGHVSVFGNPKVLLLLVFMTLTTQLYFVCTALLFTSSMMNLIGMTRIVWSAVILAIFGEFDLNVMGVIGASLVIAASFIVFSSKNSLGGITTLKY